MFLKKSEIHITCIYYCLLIGWQYFILLTDVHLWEDAKESFETEAGCSLLILC